MGNDGGSIPKRRELVKEAARIPTTADIKESEQEQQEYYWTTCPLSHQPLGLPVVSDSAGKLYNKDAVLEFLLPAGDGTPGMSKSDNEEVLQDRVRSLKDVVEVKFHVEKDYEDERLSRSSLRNPVWVCPVTNKTLGPGTKAVYLVPCGHSFLESAVKEIPGQNCLVCNEPFSTENIINILPVASADKEWLATRMQGLQEQGLTHSLKKATGVGKKRKKNVGSASVEYLATPIQTKQACISDLLVPAHTKSGNVTAQSGIKNAATALLTAKVLAEEEDKAKRRKLGSNNNLKSLFSSNQTRQKDGDFMTRGFSIPAGAKR